MSSSAENHDFDVDRQQIGALYAKALLGASEKSGKSEEVVEELTALVSEALDKHPQFAEALATPRIEVEEKLGILDRTLGGRITDELMRFLKVITKKERLDCLREISRAARRQLNERQGRIQVSVTTATPLADAQRQRIIEVLGTALGKHIDLDEHVDEDLIGGLVVRVGDTVFDGSLAGRLVRLREETLAGTIQEIQESVGRFTADTAG